MRGNCNAVLIMPESNLKNTKSGVYYSIMAKFNYNYEDNAGRPAYQRKSSGRNFWGFFWIVLLFVAAWGADKLFFGGEKTQKEVKKETGTIKTEKTEKSVKTAVSGKNIITSPIAKAKNVVKKAEARAQVAAVERDAENYPLGKVTLEQVPSLRDAENDRLFKKALAETDYQMAKTLLLKELSKVESRSSLYFRTLGKYLRALNNKILFDGIPGGKNENYVVKSGDSLSPIAIKFNLPVTAIMKANKLKNTMIYPGQRLKIYRGNWKIEVSKIHKLLYVFDGKDLFAIYDIGIGKEGRTPKGDFILTDKIEHPSWYSPDGKVVPYGEKDNVLGTHWLKIEPTGDTDRSYSGYGIHGTWDEGSITKSLSNGCIRMTNDEVAELFMYIPRKTPVKIY